MMKRRRITKTTMSMILRMKMITKTIMMIITIMIIILIIQCFAAHDELR